MWELLLFVSGKANLINLNSGVFDRFPNANREVCRNSPFCRIFPLSILLHMMILYSKHALILSPSVRLIRKKSQSGVFNYPTLGSNKLLAFREVHLTIISVSEDVPLAYYNLILTFGASLCALSFLYLVVTQKYTVAKIAIFTIFLFSCFYYLALSLVDKFYELSLNGDYIELKYAPPGKDRTIQRYEVRSVTFGLSGRTGKRCYIALNLLSGEKYESAPLTGNANVSRLVVTYKSN
ncbi:hypothetical protein AL542_13920 [Grimontia hollisae]|nr:hypothetical protein AL542_13920 [Grimontia hollisae]STO45955.1 Uncharacterised protein [Grimontia hollisae]